ncbi:MAG TPA: hypothetical protein VFB34_04105 [Chloroflexota bacterium]|nr:hypothetical protein [Chloroflexota bacterium]
MPIGVSRLARLLIIVVLAATAVACGKNTSPPAKHGQFKPAPGHVILHPTAAQSFIYLPQTAEMESNGDLLITDGGNWDRTGAKIVELTPSGKPDWVYTGGLDFPHSAYVIGSNDILISDTNNDRAFIINRQGKTIWTTDNLGGGKGFAGAGRFSDGGHLVYPNDAYMMTNGDILLSSRFNSTVWEITRSGHVVWKCSRFMLRQHRPRLLPNGDLMVADSDNGRTLIINHACNRILFEYGGFDANGNPKVVWPRSFNPYGSNYLISDTEDNRILEINHAGKILHTFADIPQPYYIEVLKNQDLLLGDSGIHGAIELSPAGSLVRQWKTSWPPGALHTSIINGGFETGGPQGWMRGDLLNETLHPGQRADMTFDSSVKHSGKSSGMISWPANRAHLFIRWEQDLKVTPGKSYTFSGWIRTKNVAPCDTCDLGPGTNPGASANFVLKFINDDYRTGPPQIALPSMQGTTGWTHQTYTLTVPPGAIGLEVTAGLFGRGTVWFDDVSVTPH